MTVSIDVKNDACSVVAPYNAKFIGKAKRLGGKWNAAGKSWDFDARDEPDVRALCLDHYGTDGQHEDLVTIRVEFTKSSYAMRNSITISGRSVIRAYGRDSGASLCDGVILREGSVGSGGSQKNWKTTVEEGTILEVRDFPRILAEKGADTNLDYSSSVSISIIADEKAPHNPLAQYTLEELRAEIARREPE